MPCRAVSAHGSAARVPIMTARCGGNGGTTAKEPSQPPLPRPIRWDRRRNIVGDGRISASEGSEKEPQGETEDEKTHDECDATSHGARMHCAPPAFIIGNPRSAVRD